MFDNTQRADFHQVAPLRALFGSSIAEFLALAPGQVIGALAANAGFAILESQRDAWLAQIKLLSDALVGLDGGIFFEFSIPRMGRRIDTVIIVGPVVFVVEFKVGSATFDRSAIDQVWDYALDLKNFHDASEAVSLVPLLVATQADLVPPTVILTDEDKVCRPVRVGRDGLRLAIDKSLHELSGIKLQHETWAKGMYRPTPTIIEAARALYAQHSVEAIARYDAGAENLRVTSRRIGQIVDEAMTQKQKVICFVTGVPGAGTTLVGLNVATRHRPELQQPTHAVFLSGNGPLVAVLREALTRDGVERRKSLGERVRKSQIGESVKQFIQNVHHFRDEAIAESAAPFEHVVIFDEAQRAWNLKQTANFMRRKKNQSGFSQSEPEFLISCMERHRDWAVIVCLVGGGQEINTGEAGIEAWLDAVRDKFPNWRMCISSRLTDSEYAAGRALEKALTLPNVNLDDSLHLAVSMRSFRAENVSRFVKAVLDCDKIGARENYLKIASRFPIVLTRNLGEAKNWLRSRARGTERFGLVASSKAQRLKPHAIDIRVDIDPVHWFLSDRDDTRSSFYLEDAATEFQVQGLELDWTCVTWDGDLRYCDSEWSYHDFRGRRWCNVSKPDSRNYLRNAYRVLLTRARQGMVIFIPEGDPGDPTRSSEFYDPTFRYLSEIGIPVIR